MTDEQFYQAFGSIRLEAEVPPKSQAGFEKKYSDITGSWPPAGPEYQSQSNKWGVEARIYFNGTVDLLDELADRGFQVTENATYRKEYAHRINNVDLFWDLVDAGFRLGDNT